MADTIFHHSPPRTLHTDRCISRRPSSSLPPQRHLLFLSFARFYPQSAFDVVYHPLTRSTFTRFSGKLVGATWHRAAYIDQPQHFPLSFPSRIQLSFDINRYSFRTARRKKSKIVRHLVIDSRNLCGDLLIVVIYFSQSNIAVRVVRNKNIE